MFRTRPTIIAILMTSMIAVIGAANAGGTAVANTGDVDLQMSTITWIRTVKTGTATVIDFGLSGKTYATIATSGRHVSLTFANTRPSSDLAQHIDVDNALGQMAINGQTGAATMTTVSVNLSTAMNAALESTPEGNGIRLSLTAVDAPANQLVSTMVGSYQETHEEAKPQPAPVVNESPNTDGGPHLYDLDAYNSDAASLFKSLASQSKTNIVIIGKVEDKVTIHFAQVPIAKAIDLLAKASGLSYIEDNGAYVVGSDKDMATAYPNETPRYKTSQRVYNCNYVDAGSLAVSLAGVYDKTLLHVSIGALERTTALSGSGSSQGIDTGGGSGGGAGGAGGYSPNSGGGSTPGTTPSSGGTAGSSSTSTGRESREVILTGNADIVDQAYALCGDLDRRRKQIKIDVSIADVSLDDLRNLGIQWTFPQFGIHEGSPNGIRFGGFQRDPLNFEATMSALEDKNKAKLLAAPSISLLDGEQGYILIGQRVSYPLLTGYSQAQTPIFSVGQEQVGILLQVKAQMTGDGEIMLSVYPQVSFITGYLNVNGASYPQVSTREQQTTIRVHGGNKVVIGGLISDEDLHDDQNVPILSKIPLFGELFKFRNSHKTRDEVIMTITPQVLED